MSKVVQDRRLLFGNWGEYTYRTFLSYSHRDHAWADRLERRLRSYVLPRELEQVWTEFGPPPKRLKPYFRDRGTQGVHHDLNEAIRGALDDSASMIVLCSPNSAQSTHVADEIIHMIAQGRRHRIFPIILEGEPGDPDQECFPAPLRFELDENAIPDPNRPVEPIAADARPGKDEWPYAFYKLVAGMVGIDADLVSRRDQKRERWERRRRIAMTSIAGLGLASVGFAWLSYDNLRDTWLAQSELLSTRSLDALVVGERNDALLYALEAVNANNRLLLGRPNTPAALDALGLILAESREDRTYSFRTDLPIAVSATGNTMIAGSGSALMINPDGADNQDRRLVLPGLIDSTALAVSGAPEAFAFIGARNGTLIVLDDTGNEQTSHRIGDSAVVAIAAPARPESGAAYAAALETGDVVLYSFQDHLQIDRFNVPGQIETLKFSDNGQTLIILSVGGDDDLATANISAGRKTLQLLTAPDFNIAMEVQTPVRQLVFGRNDRELIAIDEGGEIHLISLGETSPDPAEPEIAQEKLSNLMKTRESRQPRFTAIEYSSAFDEIVAASEDGSIRIWRPCDMLKVSTDAFGLFGTQSTYLFQDWCTRFVLPGGGTPVEALHLTEGTGGNERLFVRDESRFYSISIEELPNESIRIRNGCFALRDRNLDNAKRIAVGLRPSTQGPCDRKGPLATAPYRQNNADAAISDQPPGLDPGLDFEPVLPRTAVNAEPRTALDDLPAPDPASAEPQSRTSEDRLAEQTSEPQAAPPEPMAEAAPGCRSIGESGLALIKRFEGLELEAYQDMTGIYRIGYGHRGRNIVPGMTITEAQADTLLRGDLARVEEMVCSDVLVPLNQNEFDALVSFAYQIGANTFRTSSVLRLVNRDDRNRAALALLAWNKTRIEGKTVELTGLTRRREAERALFLTPLDRTGAINERLHGLVADLNANERDFRQNAVGTLTKEFSRDSEALRIVLDYLDPGDREAPGPFAGLSGPGRVNVLYVLTRFAPEAWSEQTIARAHGYLTDISARAEEGLSLGKDTRYYLFDLRQRLEFLQTNRIATQK